MRNWLVLVVLFWSSSTFGSDWPQWLGPQRDGGSTEIVAPWKEAPKVLWKLPVGAGFSSPVVANGRVYIHARVPDKEEEEIIALDAKTGEVRWREVYTRPGYFSGINRAPQATPAVVGGRVYSYGVNGILNCCDAESGKRVWQVHAHKLLNATLPRYGVCCSPLVVGNRVLVSVGGKGSSVVAFDTESGEIQWQAFDDPASTSSPVLFTAGGGTEKSLPDVVFMTSLRLIGVNPLDGATNWEFPLVFQPAGASPTPLIVGDQLITSTITNGSTAIRIEPKDHKPVASQTWQAKQLAGYFSSGTTSLPVGSTDGQQLLFLITNVVQPVPTAALRCVDAKTGNELWKKDDIGYFHAGVIRTGDGKLLILDDAGLLRLASVDEKGYTELCTARVCGGTLINHALADGCVYARDNNEVVCLQLSEPEKK